MWGLEMSKGILIADSICFLENPSISARNINLVAFGGGRV